MCFRCDRLGCGGGLEGRKCACLFFLLFGQFKFEVFLFLDFGGELMAEMSQEIGAMLGCRQEGGRRAGGGRAEIMGFVECAENEATRRAEGGVRRKWMASGCVNE